MRALFALAILALGIAPFSAASAADLPAGRVAYTTHLGASARARQIVIFDDQPGVRVRAYWQAPWRNRHYFPNGDGKPELGRDEDLSAGSGGAPEPAETFYREWSTSSAIVGPDYYPEPDMRNGPPSRMTDPVKP